MSIKDIASKGRYGDNHLLHVSDAEVQGLNALANSIYGHGLTTNPETGLPEAFLFAPLLAPMLAGAGTGVLGTAALAGGLGAAEAAARGMDDPLKHGLMAGLTAGAGSAIGGELANIGAESAIQGGTQVGTEAAAQNAIASNAMGVGQSVANPMTQGVGIGTSMPQATFGGTAGLTPTTPMFDATTGSLSSAGVNQGAVDLSTGMQPAGVGMGPNAPMPNITAPTPEPGFMDQMTNMGKGVGKLMDEKGAMTEFIKSNQGPLAVGAAGMYGSEALSQEQEAREGQEAINAKKKAKYDEMVARIKQNYANVGRPLPTNPYGPLFGGPQYAEGGEVAPREINWGDVFNVGQAGYKPPAGGFIEGGDNMLGSLLAKAMNEINRKRGYAEGGYLAAGGIASLKGDGMSDSVPAQIDESQPAALSDGEFVVPADVVSHLGNGSSNAGADQLYSMMDRIRKARTGTEEQAPQVDPSKYLPA